MILPVSSMMVGVSSPISSANSRPLRTAETYDAPFLAELAETLLLTQEEYFIQLEEEARLEEEAENGTPVSGSQAEAEGVADLSPTIRFRL